MAHEAVPGTGWRVLVTLPDEAFPAALRAAMSVSAAVALALLQWLALLGSGPTPPAAPPARAPSENT